MLQRIMGVKYSFPSNLQLSKDCVDLISKVFVGNPANRINITGIRAHPWFLKNLPEELRARPLSLCWTARGQLLMQARQLWGSLYQLLSLFQLVSLPIDGGRQASLQAGRLCCRQAGSQPLKGSLAAGCSKQAAGLLAACNAAGE